MAWSVPRPAPGLEDGGAITSISAAGGYAAAVSGGRLWVWGQLPGQTGWTHVLPSPRPVPAFDGTDAEDVACGTDHVLVRSKDGVVYSWGGTESGQCGVHMYGALPEMQMVSLVVDHYVKEARARAPPPPRTRTRAGGGRDGRRPCRLRRATDPRP